MPVSICLIKGVVLDPLILLGAVCNIWSMHIVTFLKLKHFWTPEYIWSQGFLKGLWMCYKKLQVKDFLRYLYFKLLWNGACITLTYWEKGYYCVLQTHTKMDFIWDFQNRLILKIQEAPILQVRKERIEDKNTLNTMLLPLCAFTQCVCVI